MDYSKEELKALGDYDKEFLENQVKARENYNNIMNALSVNLAEDKPNYPNTYGGAYINSDGNLVVYMTEEHFKDNLKNLKDSKDIIFENCKYSYNKLTDLMNVMNKYVLENNNDITLNIKEFGIKDDKNCIVVRLSDCSNEKVDDFKKQILDEEAIQFETAIGEYKLQTNINAGCEIETNIAYASVGYRAKKDTKEGFVTAAHAVELNQDVLKGANKIGTCSARVYAGEVDAVFVEITDSSYTPTNVIEGSSNSISEDTALCIVGEIVFKCGKTTKITSGKVADINVTIDIGGVRFTNLTRASYDSEAGDSGGIVYSNVERKTLGVHKSRNDDLKLAAFCKADSVNRALGIQRY